MIWIVLVELAYNALIGAAWLVLVVIRRRSWWRRPVDRLLLMWAATWVGEALALLAVGLKVPVPVALFAVLFGWMSYVVTRRLWLTVSTKDSHHDKWGDK